MGTISTQRDFLNDLINRSRGLQDALIIYQLLHVGMEVSLGLDAVVDLHEELLVDQRLDAAHGEVWHEVLAVAQVAQVIESVQEVVFEVEEGLRLVVHAEPEHGRHAVFTEEAGLVEVHGERLMAFRHLLAGLDDVGDVVDGCAAEELQRKVDVLGPAIIDESLMGEVVLQAVDHRSVVRRTRDLDGEEGSFGVHRVSILLQN